MVLFRNSSVASCSSSTRFSVSIMRIGGSEGVPAEITKWILSSLRFRTC